MARSTEAMTIDCSSHGTLPSAVVCRHHLVARDRVVGFVENSDDPNDLQAWCDECETLFEQEGALTEEFRRFNEFALVCEGCYADIKAKHSR